MTQPDQLVTQVPPELWTDRILGKTPIRDVIEMGRTCKFLSTLSSVIQDERTRTYAGEQEPEAWMVAFRCEGCKRLTTTGGSKIHMHNSKKRRFCFACSMVIGSF